MDGEIAFRQHRSGHTTGPNWPAFLEWTGRYLGDPPAAAKEPEGRKGKP